ncbi:MAG: IS110 family transposase [Gammaproteobacteria bacterium]|nr:IS110 family transposase [Gammaproteobacteria bacterium]
MHRRTVGIDLAISAEQVAQIYDDGRPVGKPLRFRLDAADLQRLVTQVTAAVSPGTPIQAVMEPTGMSWFPVARWLNAAGIEVIRVKGQRVKALRKYLSEHAKTDLADAHLLGAMPSIGPLRLEPLHLPSAEHHALQRLTKQRHRYQKLRCASKRRLLDLIRWSCPALEAALPDIFTQLAQAILHDLFEPERLLALRRDQLRRFLARHASGSHATSGPVVERRIDALRAAAHATRALYPTGVDFEALQFEVRQEVSLLRQLKSHVKALDQRCEELYRTVHPGNAIQSIPGIGAALAPVLIGAIGDVRRFANERQLRGFCDMFPVSSSSGGRDRPGQRITQTGNDRVKRALYLAADVARRIDPDLAEVYWRLMVNRGHHHKQALCAVVTRLVNRIHRVLRTGVPYQLRDRDGTPIDVQQGKAIVAAQFTVPEVIRRSRRVHSPGPIAA